MRQVVLDTETTGLSAAEGHRIIEVAAVELIDRRPTGRHYHQYIRPERPIDAGAVAVHGITEAFLAGKPIFSTIAAELLTFLRGAELVIHNAPFDVSFLNSEFGRADPSFGEIARYCKVLDTLALARKKHPGQQNSLDALCKRYKVDNSARELHGALVDTHLLMDVYLAMTGGQITLFDTEQGGWLRNKDRAEVRVAAETSFSTLSSHAKPPLTLKVIKANPEELVAHVVYLENMRKAGQECLWED